MAPSTPTRTCSGQWSSLCRFYPTLATFYLLLIAVELCTAADSLGESNSINAINNVPTGDLMHDNPSRIVDIVREQPFKEALYFRPVYASLYPTKIPFEVIYRLINENQFGGYDPIMERRRKYDQSDRSFIRFGRSDPLIAKQSRPKELRQFINYLNKRPASMADTSFLRFGRSVSQPAHRNQGP